MDSLIDKLGLYDIFGILFSGMIAIISSEIILPGKIIGLTSKYTNDFISVCVFFMVAYVIGLILQELSSGIDRNIFKLREGPKKEYLKENNTVLKTSEETAVYTELAKKILKEAERPHENITEDQMQYVYYHCTSVLESEKKDGKIKKISSIYGLSKSLSFLYFALSLISAYMQLFHYTVVCFLLCILFFIRAKRFAKFKIRVALRHYNALQESND